MESVVDLIRDEFGRLHIRLDRFDATFAQHVKDDQELGKKADKAQAEARGVKRLLHSIWVGGVALAGLVISAYKYF